MNTAFEKLGFTMPANTNPGVPRIMLKFGATLDDCVYSYGETWFYLNNENDIERLRGFLDEIRKYKALCKTIDCDCDCSTCCNDCKRSDEENKALEERENWHLLDVMYRYDINLPPMNNYWEYHDTWLDEISYFDEMNRKFDMSHNLSEFNFDYDFDFSG